jgi:hypothetical protein
MSLWSRKTFISVRVLGSAGQYPSFSLRTQGHLYQASQDLVWTAVVQRPLPEDWELSEFTPLVPEEIRLLGAITLCEADPWNHGMPLVTNWLTKVAEPEIIGFDLRAPGTFDSLSATAATIGAAPESHRHDSGTRYCVRDIGSPNDALDLLTNIDGSDQLLLAGLARLLGANRLLELSEPEEAAIILFVSMGAALERIRQHLCAEAGIDDVPFTAVHDYFKRTFPDGDDIADYYAARYEERVIATHPANRYGEFWAPPLMMGDVYHLRKSLISLYRHIVLGEVEIDQDQ